MPFPGSEDFNDLCMRIGFALATWQNVEEQHYRLFAELLGVEVSNIVSVAYFNSESFEGRRKMVSGMFHSFKSTPEQRLTWNDLERDLKLCNEERNKLAHYGIDSDVTSEEQPGGHLLVSFSNSKLRPSRFNRAAELLGRTPKDPKHNLSADDIDAIIVQFDDLAFRIGQFTAPLRRHLKPAAPVLVPPPPIQRVSPPSPLRRSGQAQGPSAQ